MGLNVGSISKVTDLNGLPPEMLETSDLLFDETKEIKLNKYGKDYVEELIKKDGKVTVGVEEKLTTEKHVCSYSDYDKFRDTLSLVAMGVGQQDVWKDIESNGVGESKYAGQPCFEIVDFPDNEGVIDGKTAKKLFEDFEKVEDDFKNHKWESDMTKSNFIKIFEDLKDALKKASDDGVFYFFVKS